jgi:uncharacterized protein (TIGR01244 family)
MNDRKITDDITVGGQPTAEELQNLRANGYRTVVNLRTPDEEGVLRDEERLAEDTGLNYSSIPVSPDTLDDIAVQNFQGALIGDDRLPALVHCKGGGRAGVLTLLHLTINNGWSLAQALEEGNKLGIAPSETSPYRAFFDDFIKRHSPAER